MAETVRVEGLRDLEKALLELPRATRKNVGRKVLRAAGQPVADAGARNAPVKEGNLRESYGVGTRLTKSARKRHKKRDPVEVFIGLNDPAAVQTEFGNEHQSAQPHLRPAWDGESRATLERIKTGLGDEIEQSAKRLERKAARLAAKNARP